MWTSDDFRAIFAFLADIHSVLLKYPGLDEGMRAVLLEEGKEASKCLSRISDAINN